MAAILSRILPTSNARVYFTGAIHAVAGTLVSDQPNHGEPKMAAVSDTSVFVADALIFANDRDAEEFANFLDRFSADSGDAWETILFDDALLELVEAGQRVSQIRPGEDSFPSIIGLDPEQIRKLREEVLGIGAQGEFLAHGPIREAGQDLNEEVLDKAFREVREAAKKLKPSETHEIMKGFGK